MFVPQVHSISDTSLVADAAEVWADTEAFGPRARMDALLALRRAARAWSPLTPLLAAAVPNSLDLADDALGDQQLTRQELDRLAEANRPMVRLRDQ